MKKYFLLFTIVLVLAACASQAVPQMTPTETQAVISTSMPTATVPATATMIPTATSNPCTDLGWADISTYVTEFQFQTLNFMTGAVVSEYLKTLRSIREKIASVAIDACAEHAWELVLSSVDKRISAQEMMMTGKFNDPNALTDALLQERPLMEAANAELARLGLKVVLSMPGSATLPSMPSNP
jgi:hypothetical protein